MLVMADVLDHNGASKTVITPVALVSETESEDKDLLVDAV